MSQIRQGLVVACRALLCTVLGIVAIAAKGAAQDDTVIVGPPPHFVAAWAPAGTLVDVSRMGPFRKRVSLDLNQAPLDSALTQIIAQADLKLVYRPGILPSDRTVSIHVKGVTAASALAEVLLDTGLDIFMTHGENLALAVCTHMPADPGGQRAGLVTGRVFSQANQAPLGGAIVTVDGTSLTTSSDGDGRYRLLGLSLGPHALRVKAIGYAPAIDTIVLGMSSAVHDFALAVSVQQLEQVVVTSTLVPTEVKALPVPIAVVTADEIRRQNVMRLTQLFRGQIAGATAWDRPADDHYNTINVRGVTSLSTTSVKTYVDGIEMADPQFTALLDPNDIERIELARGPEASTMYGSDALGGVLQVFTKKGAFGLARPKGDVRSSVSLVEKNAGPGFASRLEEAMTLRGGEQRTRYQVAAYYRHDGEWTPSYRNTNWSVTASAENIQGPLTSRVSAIFARKMYDRAWAIPLRDSGYAAYSKPPFQDVDLQTQTYGANFVYTPMIWWRNELVLGYDRWAFTLLQAERRLTSPADTFLQALMNQRGKMSIFYYTSVHATFSKAVKETVTLGFNHYRLDGSDVSNPETNSITGALGGSAVVVRAPSTNNGYFAQAQVDVAGRLFVTSGLRVESSPGFGRNLDAVVSPRVGFAYNISLNSASMKLRAAYGESVRAPDPAQNQQFSGVGFERLHNPALRPERQRGGDGGVDVYWASGASVSATYYDQTAEDLIDQVVVSSSPVTSQQQNVGEIKNRGWEFEARYNSAHWQLAGSLSLPQSRIQQLDASYGGDYRVGDRLFDVPRHMAGITVTYSPFTRMSLWAGMTNSGSWIDKDWVAFFGSRFGNVPPRPSVRDYWITYPAFTKLRFGVECALWGPVVGTFGVENVTNRRVFETHDLDVPTPRILTFGVRAGY